MSGTEEDGPVLRIYRTNGMIWALFEEYSDGTEQPADIFESEHEVFRSAQQHLPYLIEYRPQELGCEMSEEELSIIPILAQLYDARIERNQKLLGPAEEPE